MQDLLPEFGIEDRTQVILYYSIDLLFQRMFPCFEIWSRNRLSIAGFALRRHLFS
jgi:bacteriorhodopsin